MKERICWWVATWMKAVVFGFSQESQHQNTEHRLVQSTKNFSLSLKSCQQRNNQMHIQYTSVGSTTSRISITTLKKENMLSWLIPLKKTFPGLTKAANSNLNLKGNELQLKIHTRGNTTIHINNDQNQPSWWHLCVKNVLQVNERKYAPKKWKLHENFSLLKYYSKSTIYPVKNNQSHAGQPLKTLLRTGRLVCGVVRLTCTLNQWCD